MDFEVDFYLLREKAVEHKVLDSHILANLLTNLLGDSCIQFIWDKQGMDDIYAPV